MFSGNSVFAECEYHGGDIGQALDNCLDDTSLVDASGNMNIEAGVKNKIIEWTQALAAFFWLLAVGSIVYWWFLMTISGWEDERVKKGKDVIKWGLIWFLALVFTSAIIRIVVEFIFSVAS